MKKLVALMLMFLVSVSLGATKVDSRTINGKTLMYFHATSDPTFHDTTNFMPTNADCKLSDGTWIGAVAPPKASGWLR